MIEPITAKLEAMRDAMDDPLFLTDLSEEDLEIVRILSSQRDIRAIFSPSKSIRGGLILQRQEADPARDSAS